jgi:murein DD-endopeptidase MepM/ murein hydrolase activator NlpD
MISKVQKAQLDNLRSKWKLDSGISQRNRVAYVLKRSKDNYIRVTGSERGLMQYQAECLEYVEGIGNHHEVARFERNRVLTIIDKAFVSFPSDHVVSKLVEDFKDEIYGIFRRKPKALDLVETDSIPVTEIVLSKEQVPGPSMLVRGVGLFQHWSRELSNRSKKYAVVAVASTLIAASSPAHAGTASCAPDIVYAQTGENGDQSAYSASNGVSTDIPDPSSGYYFPHMRYPFNPSTISSGFGYRNSPCIGCSSNHKGLDFAVGYGTKVPAVIAGTVTKVRYSYELGNYVSVDAGHGMETVYAHLSSVSVSVGDKISLGQIIGKVGSTGLSSGNHLHLEIRMYGEAVDPLPILRQYVR